MKHWINISVPDALGGSYCQRTARLGWPCCGGGFILCQGRRPDRGLLPPPAPGTHESDLGAGMWNRMTSSNPIHDTGAFCKARQWSKETASR